MACRKNVERFGDATRETLESFMSTLMGDSGQNLHNYNADKNEDSKSQT